MISVIITAFKEESTIGQCIKTLIDPRLSGFSDKIQLIQVSPDQATLNAGKLAIDEISNTNVEYLQLTDPNQGKPIALNIALRKTKHPIVILTDGDVQLKEQALGNLVQEFIDKKIDAACGRVISINDRESFMGYISHLMTDAADHKRKIKLGNTDSGYGTQIVKSIENNSEFFPLSGYLMIFNQQKIEALLKSNLKVPEDCLVEDAYLSYLFYISDLRLGYIPEAEVAVKFPTTYSDYMKQKKRSTGGYIQLWKYGVVEKSTNSRSFLQELGYFWFPIKYATNLRELIYSLAFYPLRLWLWFKIWWERKVLNKDFVSTWVRIESTK